MTTTQNFQVYKGDAVFPLVTVKLANGSLADLSQATEISWTVVSSTKITVLVKKLSTGGGISLPNGGTDGVFQINLTMGSTSNMSGAYKHFARVYDSLGQATTVMIGSFTVVDPSS